MKGLAGLCPEGAIALSPGFNPGNPAVRLSILDKESEVGFQHLPNIRFIGIIYFCQRILTALQRDRKSTVLGKLDSFGMSQKPEIASGPQTTGPHNRGVQLGNLAIYRVYREAKFLLPQDRELVNKLLHQLLKSTLPSNDLKVLKIGLAGGGAHRCRKAVAIAATMPKGIRMKRAMRVPIAMPLASGERPGGTATNRVSQSSSFMVFSELRIQYIDIAAGTDGIIRVAPTNGFRPGGMGDRRPARSVWACSLDISRELGDG